MEEKFDSNGSQKIFFGDQHLESGENGLRAFCQNNKTIRKCRGVMLTLIWWGCNLMKGLIL
jgi:hypothetical protein